jgi:hypothetical protein
LIHCRSLATNKSSHGCSPTLIQHTSHALSSEQIAFINRGPTYVSPCQLRLWSTLSLNDLLAKQIAPLRRQLTRVFTRYPVDLSRRMNFERDIRQLFKQSFSKTIPLAVERRSHHEKQLMQSIDHQLETNNLILRRTADDSNVYYLGRRDEFNDVANIYLQNSTTFELFGVIDDSNCEALQLNRIRKSIDMELETLYQKKWISKDHLQTMLVGKRTHVQLPCLYFLPETNDDGHLSVQPRLSSYNHCPIQSLANYLDRLLRPLFENFSRSTVASSSGDFMQRLDAYGVQQDALLPRTRLVAFKIHHAYHHMKHDRILTALNQFLVHPLVNGRHERLTSDTIEALTALVLRHHWFCYQGRLYRYVRGSPVNSSFSRLLLDIYLHHWQASLVHQVRLANEFYCRYHDQGLFTWYDDNVDQVRTYFQVLNEQYSDIRVTLSIDFHVDLLGASIENRKGNLFTRVQHDVNRQPFLLPHVTGHPRLMHRQWYRFALIRAGHYCMAWEDFEDERLRIELTFLANGYSLNFVEFLWKEFYQQYNPIRGETRLNRWTYPSLRRELFRRMNHDQQQKPIDKAIPMIHFYYLFDWGSRCEFNRKFQQLWTTNLEEDPTFKKYGLRIKLNTKHCYASHRFFH